MEFNEQWLGLESPHRCGARSERRGGSLRLISWPRTASRFAASSTILSGATASSRRCSRLRGSPRRDARAALRRRGRRRRASSRASMRPRSEQGLPHSASAHGSSRPLRLRALRCCAACSSDSQILCLDVAPPPPEASTTCPRRSILERDDARSASLSTPRRGLFVLSQAHRRDRLRLRALRPVRALPRRGERLPRRSVG